MNDTVRRRNGQLSSCEPCRKSKLRCDHGRPVCGRCLRRGGSSAARCYYHPAPMTGAKDAMREIPITPQSVHVTTTPTSSSTAAPAPTPSEYSDRATGLLGMNSSLLAFQEPDEMPSRRTYATLTQNGVATPRQQRQITPLMIEEGIRTLKIIAFELDIDDFVMQRFPGLCEGWVHDIISRAAWSATHELLTSVRSGGPEADLGELSRMIFRNTSRPILLPDTAENNALEAAFAGDNIRWDIIALYSIRLGLFLGSGKESLVKPLDGQYLPPDEDRETIAQQAYLAAMQCRSFSDNLGQINDLSLWFMNQAIVLATWCFGDDSYCAYKLHGEQSTLIYALGYHRGFQGDNITPPYLLESRKRAVAHAYEGDKEIAIFTGRPPCISRHFTTIDLPLDLSEEEITGTREVFEMAKASLDENGWNRQGNFTSSSGLRAQYLLCILREEILELSLGPTQPDHPQLVRSLLHRIEATWQSIPNLHDLIARKHELHGELFGRIANIHDTYLYDKFLLYKMLVGHDQTARGPLVLTAHELLRGTLDTVKQRNRIVTHRAEMEFILVFYGMPCASVLMLELLRRDRRLPGDGSISRSTLIKDLYAMTSCCDFVVEAGRGNHDTVKKAQGFFLKGLDQILNQDETPPAATTSVTQESTSQQAATNGEFEGISQDPEWTAWLESIGLQPDPWFDFQDYPNQDPSLLSQ